MYIKRKFLLIAFALGFYFLAKAQVTITGPTCVMPGTTYTYTLQGISPGANATICVSGGLIVDSTARECSGSPGLSSVNVCWNGLVQSGTLALDSSFGNISLSVNVITSIIAGSIDSSSKFQTVDTLIVPSTIVCSSALDGSCNPSYNYQWQQSEGDMIWVDIDGATNQNLTFSEILRKQMFYRRRVIDTNSNTIGFSDQATIFISY